MTKKAITCPQCGKANTWNKENSFRPFCSERCRLIDLGAWASEKYSIPGDEKLPETGNDEDSN